jgi:hypothetical protein
MTRNDTDHIDQFLIWVEKVYGKTVRDLCDQKIAEFPIDEEFNPDQILGDCYQEHSRPMLESASRMATIPYGSRFLEADIEDDIGDDVD